MEPICGIMGRTLGMTGNFYFLIPRTVKVQSVSCWRTQNMLPTPQERFPQLHCDHIWSESPFPTPNLQTLSCHSFSQTSV